MILTRSVLLALTGLAAACSGGPGVSPQLIEARSAYEQAASDPQVVAAAPLELREAAASLRRAEQADSDAEMNHRSYLARQRVSIARETAALEQARNTIAHADRERAEALLETRNRQVAEAQVQADIAEARAQALEAQLRDLEAKRTERGILVTLGDVLFATGSAELTPGAETRIARLAEFLQRYPDQTVRVEGYTDSTGASDFNLRLSERRAYAVRDALVRHGADPSRIDAFGFGAARPVADNATQAGRQANRRVEIVISDPEGTLAARD